MGGFRESIGFCETGRAEAFLIIGLEDPQPLSWAVHSAGDFIKLLIRPGVAMIQACGLHREGNVVPQQAVARDLDGVRSWAFAFHSP